MLERNRDGAVKLLEILEEEEKLLVFESFSNEDALKLGNILAEIMKDSVIPITIRVFLGDVIVFQYTMAGEEDIRFGWTFRKYQLIKETGHSSMHGKVRALILNELQDLYANKDKYGFGCGGFPIAVKGKGLVGAVALSGLPDPADHIYVIEALEKFAGLKVPHIPEEIDENWIN